MNGITRTLAAALIAGAAMTAPAMAKDAKAAPAAPAPKLSKPVAIALQAAQKLMAAGDNAGALEKIKEAEAAPNQTPDDIYFEGQLRLNAAIALKDNAMIESTLKALLATGRVSPADQPKFLRNIGAMALQRKDYNGATQAFEQLVKIAPNDPDAIVGLAELYQAQKQTGKAIDMLGQAIAASKAAGQVPPENWYRRQLGIAYDAKLTAQIQPAAQALVAAYPNAVNWRDALIISRDSYKLDDVGSLDFMRLQAATGSLNGERDFVEYADTALGKGLPGEAKTALEDGIAKKMLTPTKPIVVELMKSATGKIPTDKASLAGLEKESRSNPKLALGTGDAYYGYGDYAKAATLYKYAVGVPTIDQSIANLRLGAALARAGDKAGATAALSLVKGGARETLAKYWMIWIGQKA